MGRAARCRRTVLWSVFLLLGLAVVSQAKVGISYQIAMGNPSEAVTDAALRTNYLIARDQYAISYNDDTHQANWVGWSYSAADSGSTGRTDAWAVESALPTGYLKIGTASFGTGWDRGHMCPSGDRTATVTDNEFTFRMSNMIPQASSNNQGLWANFETYCRSLAADGSEIHIISGPSGFTGATISNGMRIPGSVWKVALKVPDGSGTAASRVTTSCRVIAINTPNTSTGLGSWQSYITSVEQIEENTGLRFFSDVDPSVATYLKNVVDTGTASNNPTVITSFSPSSGAVGTSVGILGYNFGSSPVVRFNGVAGATTVISPTLISAVVPAGATTGDLSVTGTGGTDTGAVPFTLLGGSTPLLALSIPSLGGFTSTEGTPGPSQSYTLSGSNLGGDITVSAPPLFELSLDNITFSSALTLVPVDGLLSNVLIRVRLTSSAPAGTVNGVITHSGGSADPQGLAVAGTVASTAPSLVLSTGSLNGFSAIPGAPGASKSYTLAGFNLTGPVTVAAPGGFELSLDDLSFSSGLVLVPVNGTLTAVPVHVRLQSSAVPGAFGGVISHTGGGAAARDLTVSGNVANSGGGLVRLAGWEFTGLSAYGPSPMSATVTAPGVTVGGLTRGSGVTTLNTAAGSAWGGNGFDGSAVLADAVTRGDFATFSITPATGVSLSFRNIPAYNIRRSSTGPTTGQWQYQLGSGPYQNIGNAITWGGVTTSAGNPQPSLDLSGVAGLQNVASGIPVTFRLVAYGASSSGGNFYLNNITGDDLAVMGTANTASITTPVIASAPTASSTAFEGFIYQITASNTPTSFAATGLPGGLSINTATGLISGSPLVPGIYQVILTASNGSGDGTADLVITVSPNPGAPAIGGTLAATARLRAPFEYQIQASNSPTAWLAAGLPPGMSINTATGLIGGTPSQAGTFVVPVTVQNALGSDSSTVTFTVVDPVLEVVPADLAEFSSFLGFPGLPQTYVLSGSSLAGQVTVMAPEGFEINLDGGAYTRSLVLEPANGTITPISISLRLSASTPLGAYSGSIIHSGGGAIPRYIAVSGTVSALVPTLGLSTASLGGFSSKVGTVSFVQGYSVTGVNLTGPVTVAAPPDFEISLDGSLFSANLILDPVDGNLGSVTVQVRLAATAPAGNPSGNIVHSGGGAAAQVVALSGSVTDRTGPVIASTTSGSVYVGGNFSHAITVEGSPTMVSYDATGLPVGLAINPSTGVISGTPTVAGTSVIQLHATSTDGTTAGSYTLKVMTAAEQAAIPLSVVINKFLNGTTDQVELLVTGDTIAGPPVDLRGMVLKDFNSNMGSDLGGRLVFKSVPLWAAVKAGTLVVLSNGSTEVEDSDPSDFVLRINLGNSNYFAAGGGSFDIGNTEMVMLKTADSGVDGVAGGIHALAAGGAGSQYSLFSGRKMRASNSLTTRNAYAYAINSQAKLSDFYSGSGASTTRGLIFGAANNTNNSIYINSLRGLDQAAPVITLAGANPMTVAHSGVFVDPGASAVDAIDGIRGVTSTGIVNPLAVGSYQITYTTSDLAGNVATATRTVRVTDQAAPVLTLNGPAEWTVAAGGVFEDPGASAVDAVDGILSVAVSGAINASAVGAYTIVYSAVDAAGNQASVSRTVLVNDLIPPVVGLMGPSTMTVPAGSVFVDPGAVAVDAIDGNRQVLVLGTVDTAVVGTYTVIYSASDLSENVGTSVRTVHVNDQSPPRVTLSGASTIRIPAGALFIDPGASATDTVDGVLLVDVVGTVDRFTPGTYVMSYSATDLAGNTSSAVVRTVEVLSEFDYAMTETRGLSGGDAAAGADPDGDGWTNLQEFCFGLDPTVPGGRLVDMTSDAGVLHITYLQRSGVNYSIESSTDLKTWSTGAVTPVVSSVQPENLPQGYTRYEATLPTGGNAGFLRVEASVP